MADEIANARKDAEKAPVGPEPIIGVIQQHVNVCIKGNVFQEHYCRWREKELGLGLRQSKNFIDGSSPGRTRQLLGETRRGWWGGLLTGLSKEAPHLIGSLEGSRWRECGLEEE